MFKKFSFFVLFIVLSAIAAEAQPCNPLPPPAAVYVTNITDHSADVSWLPSGTGAWYRVRLFKAGILVDESYTQALVRSYNNLQHGTAYDVCVGAVECPTGIPSLETCGAFKTSIIIPDFVCSLQQTNGPDQQADYVQIGAGDTLPGLSFSVCLPKVDTAHQNRYDNAFHAYIVHKDFPSDFLEFAVMADLQNGVHFSCSPLVSPNSIMCMKYYDEYGNIVIPDCNHPGTSIVTAIIWRGQMPLLTMTIQNLVVQQYNQPMNFTLSKAALFYVGDNNCIVGSDCNNSPRPGRNSRSELRSGPAPEESATGIAASVSPNPIRELLTVRMDENSTPVRSIRIIDAAGRRCHEVFFSDSDFSGTYDIPCAEWRAGMYYVQIVTDETVITKTVVKVE